ncbi:hypothetical protein GGX14DRAFT_560028 [Mycena pura]|uniref:F-box domain-containing protein n=1 Tax=Mycena pura TaxID=153505 RepID=A0AAD6YHC6_9AGAR|nr:hypothetical protein GGX14DRAFT_560028 [Mycena pura]
MSSLPFDVLMEIMPHIDFPDLPAVARTNKELSAYALDRIYEHIPPKALRMACASISANPALARRVKALELNSDTYALHLESILPAISDALRTTPNLRALTLNVDGSHAWVLKPAIGVFKLRSLSCFFFTDDNLIDFFHDQTALEEITLTHSFVRRTRPITWTFPNLKTFDGPMSWADAMRPPGLSRVVISHIVAGGSLDLLGTLPIRHLQIPLHAAHKSSPAEFGALFPALEYLVLSTALDRWGVPLRVAIPGLSEWLRDLLAELHTVQSFHLLEYSPEPDRDATYFVKTVTERAPWIREVSLRYSKYIRSGQRLVVWKRGVNGWENAGTGGKAVDETMHFLPIWKDADTARQVSDKIVAILSNYAISGKALEIVFERGYNLSAKAMEVNTHSTSNQRCAGNQVEPT